MGGWGSQVPPEDGTKRLNMRELLENPDTPYFYDIPYRALVHKRLENVLAAGRNLSSDVPGQSGTRLIMCSMSMGEAAGLAAAQSLKEGVTVRNIDVKKLQETILANGGNLYDFTERGSTGKTYEKAAAKHRHGTESKFIDAINAKRAAKQ